MVGVGAVVFRAGKVLLIRRGHEPLRGRWVVPGGKVRWGERLRDAVVRETREETGLRVVPREVLKITDQIHRSGRAIRYHFVLIDYLCDWLGGEARAASDAEALAWVGEDELTRHDVPAEMMAVLLDAYSRAAARGAAGREVQA